MKRLIVLLYAFVLGISGKAQTVPAERIFFCSDQAEYSWDDSICISGIVISTDTTKLPESHYAYIDAFTPQDSLCLHVRLRCMADGSFSLKAPVEVLRGAGRFYCRAYTRLMLNEPPEAIPLITIRISDGSFAGKQWNCSADLNMFDLQEAFTGVSDTLFKAEKSLEISGVALYRIDKRPVKNGTAMAYQRSNQKVYTAFTDQYGHFSIPVDDYFTGEEFYLQAYDKHGKDYPCLFQLDEPYIPPVTHQGSKSAEEEMCEAPAEGNNSSGGLYGMNVLPELNVRSRQKNKDLEKERRSFFKTRFLNHDDIAEHGIIDMMSLIQFFSHFMRLDYDNITNKSVLVSTRPCVIFNEGRRGKSSIKIVVDGVECSFDEINNNLVISDIEEAEYLKPGETLGMMGVRFAIDGALVIKTRQAKSNLPPMNSKGQIFVMKGIDDLQ